MRTSASSSAASCPATNFSFFVRSFLPRYPPPEADAIENLSMAVVVDQKRLGGGSHSTVGTITDIYTVLRLIFSRVGQPHVGYSNAFSFNDPQGMCPECSGLGKKLGVVSDDFLDRSKSLNEGAVQVPFFAPWEQGMYAASGFFDNDKKLADFTPEELDLLLYSKPKKYKLRIGDGTMNATYMGIVRKLRSMHDVGLEYLTLGQPLSTLSGGECQRIKLASELHKRDSVYVLDEPTTGLHRSDITHLLAIMNRLVDGGNTVIVIEHNLDIIRNADWIVDLGPEGGSKGGRVMFEGTPRDLLNVPHSLTSRYLEPAVATPA
jgi:excinuclease UvrABC ATPase subunit